MTERCVSIHVPAMTRVEGEGSLRIRIENDRIEDLALDLFEPPRYFEKFLEGRRYHEVLDITARICGICPIAYQMSAAQALENAFGIDPGRWVRDMRRVFYCGEWLQSHALHVHLLAAPDFLGFDSVVGMAEEHPQAVRRGLRLQGLGNELIRSFGTANKTLRFRTVMLFAPITIFFEFRDQRLERLVPANHQSKQPAQEAH